MPGTTAVESHTEEIVCPACRRGETATVLHTQPWHSYVHECSCGYMILESEWQHPTAAQPFEDQGEPGPGI